MQSLIVSRDDFGSRREPLLHLLDRKTSLTLSLEIYLLCYTGHVNADLSFLLQGIQQGLFSTTWPYLPGGLRAYNDCAGCRCQVNEEVLERYQEEHQTGTAASSSTTPSVEQITVNLPTGVKVYGSLDEENYERRDHLIFAGTEPNRTKILFLDFHQVLDRSASETTYETGKIPDANVEVVGRIVDYAADRGVKLFVFVLSYTKDRIQHILDALESTQSIILRLRRSISSL